jgi:hypothetical protein
MPSSPLRRLLGGMTVIGAALLAACGGRDSPTGPGPGPDPDPLPDPTPVIQGRTLFGLTCSNNLVEFGSGNPGTLARYVAVTQDRLRLSSVEGNQNLSIDPLTGTVASADPDLAFAAGDANTGGNPAISALAYRETGGSSTLYAVDATANALVTVDPATGGLTTVGDFGRNVYLCSGLATSTRTARHTPRSRRTTAPSSTRWT